jgi:protein-tyrosine phosphatase
MKILLVCMGNICRSPIAEGIMRKIAADRKLNVEIDSAGTSHWHAGEHPDVRAIRVAAGHGIDISKLVARQFTREDYKNFDRIYVMDDTNLEDVIALASSEADREKVKLFLDEAGGYFFNSVPDPYYGSPDGFEKVFSMLEEAGNKIFNKFQPQ